MYAVIVSGGKQHRVKEGETLKLEKLEVETGATVEFVDESIQLPPFMHGCDAHSALSTAQFAPFHPTEQLHTYTPTPIDRPEVPFDSVQLPPF